MYCISEDKVLENLKKLEAKDKVSEIDTQIFLVEPIFYLAGIDMLDPQIVKRANRGRKVQGDIEVLKDGKCCFFIEVKSIKNGEEFPDNLVDKIKEKGALEYKDCKLQNKNKDALGQLRLYVYKYVYKLNKLKHINNFYPILTNGKQWIIFYKLDCLLNDIYAPLSCEEGDFKYFNISRRKDLDELIKYLRFLKAHI